jgi:hypothetical protein
MTKLVLFLTGILCLPVVAQDNSPQSSLLARRYREGETLNYRMTATTEGMHYEADAKGIVKRNPSGHFIEEYAWSNLVRNGMPVPLPPPSLTFRQILSLDPRETPAIPNLAEVPRLGAPILDLLTFYADLWLTIREANLNKAGDHFFQEGMMASSWADGAAVVLGQTAIDFDITLTAIDQDNQVATVLVRHVPPKKRLVTLPADWMSARVGETENNWVSVRRTSDNYVAAMGKETFDVEMHVSLTNGAILAATLDNIVDTRERDCSDAALVHCGDYRSRRIARQIQIVLVR